MGLPHEEYLETIKRMEPDICAVDAAAGWASIAISLKRLADSQDKMLALMTAEIERRK